MLPSPAAGGHAAFAKDEASISCDAALHALKRLILCTSSALPAVDDVHDIELVVGMSTAELLIFLYIRYGFSEV